MKTNETIFKEITENGVITKQQLQLLKIRSNKQQKDVINYDWLQSVGDGYGIPLTVEQGVAICTGYAPFGTKNKNARKVCERWEKLYYNYDFSQRKRMIKRFARELSKIINN